MGWELHQKKKRKEMEEFLQTLVLLRSKIELILLIEES